MNPLTVDPLSLNKNLFRAMPGNSALLLPDAPYFTIIAVTSGYELVAGKSAAELEGKRLFDIFPSSPDSRESGDGLRQSLQLVMEDKKPNRQPIHRYDIRNREGVLEEQYWSVLNTPVLNDDGSVQFIIHTTEEVTNQVKRKRGEIKLANIESAHKAIEAAHQETDRQKRLMEAISNNTLDLQYIFDLNYRFTYANKALLEMWGTTFENSIGKGLLELGYEPWHAEMHEREIDQVVATKQPIRGVVSFPHATLGKRVYDYLFVPVFNEKGEVEAIAGTTRDVSDFKEAEASLEQRVKERTQELENQKSLVDNILTNSSNGISVTEMVRDEKGEVIDARTILANDAAVKFVGLPKEVYLSTLATEIDPNILQSPYGQMCLNTLKTGEPSFSQYFLEMTGRWLELTISRMDDDHLIHIFTDVTPIKEAQLQLEHTVEDLKRTNQNLEEFAYAASHDMKEPIRKMHYFADRLKGRLEGKLEQEDKSYFERLERSAKRMGNLIDDLLLYSNVSRGAILDEEVDLNITIQRVLEDLELEISEKAASINVGKLPHVKGNRRQLQQLFQNLVSNALKYGKADTRPQIDIQSKELPGDPAMTGSTSHPFHLITVKDNGIGFDQKDANRIFNVFTRLHGNNEFRGTGVGLSIAQKVVQNHGGRIWAESTPGEGAMFSVLLPVPLSP